MYLGSSNTLELPLLQHTQKFGLQGERQFTNFIQENGAALSHFEAPAFQRYCSSESPLFMPEQFALE